jgi:hypothetical protein
MRHLLNLINLYSRPPMQEALRSYTELSGVPRLGAYPQQYVYRQQGNGRYCSPSSYYSKFSSAGNQGEKPSWKRTGRGQVDALCPVGRNLRKFREQESGCPDQEQLRLVWHSLLKQPFTVARNSLKL